MPDLSVLSIIIEIGLSAIVGKQTLLMNKQEEVLGNVEKKVDKEFGRIENRVDNLLQRFDEDIRETTSVNHETRQVLQEAKGDINESLSAINVIVQDLKIININLLADFKLLTKLRLTMDENKK